MTNMTYITDNIDSNPSFDRVLQYYAI